MNATTSNTIARNTADIDNLVSEHWLTFLRHGDWKVIDVRRAGDGFCIEAKVWDSLPGSDDPAHTEFAWFDGAVGQSMFDAWNDRIGREWARNALRILIEKTWPELADEPHFIYSVSGDTENATVRVNLPQRTGDQAVAALPVSGERAREFVESWIAFGGTL